MKKLKVNFQKILCIIFSCVLVFSVLTLPVSADSSFSDNTSSFISHVKDSYQDYKNGDISFSQFISDVTYYSGRYGMVAGAELTGIPDILDLLKSFGIDVQNPWEDFYFRHHGGGGSGGNRDILNGYGALLLGEELSSSSNPVSYYYYCDYIIALPNAGSPPSLRYDTYNTYFVSYNADGSIYQSVDNGAGYSVMPSQRTECSWSAYGDVRFEDGSSADDYTTPFPDEIIPNYDDSSVSQDDLEDFLEDLLNQLSLQFPDLSTVEGLLSALLSEMKTLDHDDDSAGLAAVQSAIDGLSSVGSSGSSSVSSSDIEKIISTIENNQFDYDKLVQCLTDLLGLNGDYSEISKLEVVKNKFTDKIGFVSSFADLCGKVITAYTKSSPSVSFDFSLYGESHTISFDWLEDYMPTFRIMLCAFIYISYVWRTFRKVPGYISGGGENQ